MNTRVKLALSYAVFLVISGGLLLAVVWVFLLRYVPTDTSAAAMWTPSRSDLVEAFGPKFVLAFFALLIVGLAGGWLLAGQMLAPLERISVAARRAAEGSLSHRIQLPGRSNEFTELADVFDDMLAELEAHVAERERFAANASHELRTPLAVTKTLVEVARADPHRDVDLLLERLDAVTTRAITLADSLLLLSKTGRQLSHLEDVDLSLVVEEAIETLLPLAEGRGVTLESDGEPVLVRGSSVLLQQLAINLLHNAIVHNLPKGGYVWIRTLVDRGRAVMVFENTGRFISPGVVPTLLEPFQREAARTTVPRHDQPTHGQPTKRTGADHAGAGLGLAIAWNIVRAHRGEVYLNPREDGGLNVTVALPLG